MNGVSRRHFRPGGLLDSLHFPSHARQTGLRLQLLDMAQSKQFPSPSSVALTAMEALLITYNLASCRQKDCESHCGHVLSHLTSRWGVGSHRPIAWKTAHIFPVLQPLAQALTQRVATGKAVISESWGVWPSGRGGPFQSMPGLGICATPLWADGAGGKKSQGAPSGRSSVWSTCSSHFSKPWFSSLWKEEMIILILATSWGYCLNPKSSPCKCKSHSTDVLCAWMAFAGSRKAVCLLLFPGALAEV